MRWFKAAFSSQYQELQAVKKELEVLREYDTIIIVDDSSSMIKEDRWGTVSHKTFISPVRLQLIEYLFFRRAKLWRNLQMLQ